MVFDGELNQSGAVLRSRDPVATNALSKGSKDRSQYQDSNQADDATDDYGHDHVEVAFTVSQTADLQQQ
jgi:hypothetical protein